MGADGRLAIVHEWLPARAGSEKAFEAMARTFPQADLYALTRDPGVPFDFGGRHVTTTFLDRRMLRLHRGPTLPLMPLAWNRIAANGPYATVLTSSHAFSRSFPPTWTARHLCYCHSPARYLWMDQLDHRGAGLGPAADAGRRILRCWDLRTVATVDEFAANST